MPKSSTSSREKKPFGAYENLCNRVYESGSVELIARCFGKPELSYDMWARILPENSPTLNKRNVLIVLRAGPEQWFEPVYPQPVWDRPAAFGVRVEYCLETLRQYIPEKQLKRYQLDKRQGRLDAANRLESATLLSANPGNPMDWRWFSAAGSVLLVLAGWLILKRRPRSTPD